MDDETRNELDPGPAAVRGYIHRALNLLAREIRKQASISGGTIGTEQIGVVLESFKRADSPVLAAICQAAWDDCGAIFESEGRGEDRKAPFQRLMVWPFAHLLPEHGDRDGSGRILSRRVIPGYIAAVEDLVGPVFFGRQQERTRELVRAARNARGGAFLWEDVYADQHAQDIVDGVLVHLAAEFTDFEQQRDWFVGLVNDAMPLPTNGSDHAVALGDEGFDMLMQALYSRLARALSTEKGEARLTDRHGAPAVANVRMLLSKLGKS